jgi:hypothetical protein
MKKIIVVYTALYLIIILSNKGLVFAQDTAFFISEHVDVIIKPFRNNTVGKDFGPFVWHDNIFITSSRPTLKNTNKLDPISKQPFLNVYAFDMEYNLVNLKFLPSSLNKKVNCGPLTIASDTSLLVITRNYAGGKKKSVKKLYLAYYVREKNKWSKRKMFPFNDVNYSLQHPYFDNQTNTLYFSSNLPGGYGKFDLYMSHWDGKNWTTPENLGPKINSPYNELFPSLYPGGGLMYSCDQREASGGLDIIFYRNNTRYLLPEPFNTSHDDFSISFINASSGYLASNRDQLTSEENIYSFEFVSSFIIRVLDRNTKMPVKDVQVAIQSKNPPLKSTTVTSGIGESLIYKGSTVPFSVSLELRKEGYLPQSIVSGDFLPEKNLWVLTLNMEPVPEETTTTKVSDDKVHIGYYIIVGSYKNLKEAQKKVEKLRNDLNANVIALSPTKEGYYRISYGEYSTLEEARSKLNSIRAEVSNDAWILSDKN